MKEIFDGLGEAAKEFYDMLPFNDPERKYQRALEKLKELKKRENEVYADIGRKLYQEEGASGFPQEVEKLHKIYDERRMAELEVTRLQQERQRCEQQQQDSNAQSGRCCPHCGAVNTAEVRFCRDCGSPMQTQVTCSECGAQNPAGTRFCGLCGKRMASPEKGDEGPE